MGFLSKLFGGKKKPEPKESDDDAGEAGGGSGGIEEPIYEVELHLAIPDSFKGSDMSAFHDLQDKIEERLQAKGLGDLDGDGFGEGFCDIFFNGSDGEAMWKEMEHVVRKFGPAKGSHAEVGTKRSNGGSGKTRRIDL
jgi:hypothetical protein